MVELSKIATEQRNPNTMHIDELSTEEMVKLINREDHRVAEAVGLVTGQIAKAVDLIAAHLKNGGRLIYCGAGTSGRLGILDAVECPPTYSTDPEMVQALMAGGYEAIFKAVEGAEDSRELGRQDLIDIKLEARDIVIGIAASGRTPYVLGGLAYAKEVGCHTVGISCNPGSAVGAAAELAIEVVPGPECLTGSTRLKSGTCQKLILNMISTATMVGCGKAYQNLMVDVMQTNEKLVVRAQNIVMEATGCDRETAAEKIAIAGGNAKTAITMILADCGLEEAKARLEKAKGHVREAIK